MYRWDNCGILGINGLGHHISRRQAISKWNQCVWFIHSFVVMSCNHASLFLDTCTGKFGNFSKILSPSAFGILQQEFLRNSDIIRSTDRYQDLSNFFIANINSWQWNYWKTPIWILNEKKTVSPNYWLFQEYYVWITIQSMMFQKFQIPNSKFQNQIRIEFLKIFFS